MNRKARISEANVSASNTFYKGAKKPSHFDDVQNKVYENKILHLTEVENRYKMLCVI